MKIVIIGNGMATDAFLESWGELPSSVKTQWEITVFGDETLTCTRKIPVLAQDSEETGQEKSAQTTSCSDNSRNNTNLGRKALGHQLKHRAIPHSKGQNTYCQ